MSTPYDRPYDFVAIGLGPRNLGLACLTAPIDELDGVFLHDKPDLDWHPGFLPEDATLPEDTTLRVPFLADLVSLADPTSPYSFLDYLKRSGRPHSFHLRRDLLPSRGEYVDYCRWAAAGLDTVRFDRPVTAVEYDHVEDLYVVHADRLASRPADRLPNGGPNDGPRSVVGRETYRAKRLVLDTGYRHRVPAYLAPIADRIAWEDDGRFSVWWNFSIDKTCRAVYAQSAGPATSDSIPAVLGTAAHRNACIIRELLGREHYPVEGPDGLQEYADRTETSSRTQAMSM